MISQIRNVLSNKVIDNIKDEFGRTIYEAFKNLIISGLSPLTLTKSKGVDLIDYKLYGNSVQDGTPTPDTPIEIESVGDRTKNLFDAQTLKFTAVNSSEIKVTGTNSLTISAKNPTRYHYIYFDITNILKVSKTYTISALYDNSLYGKYTVDEFDSSGVRKNADLTTFTVEEGCTYRYKFYANPTGNVINDDSTITINYSNIMLEEGNASTEYEPYGYKIPVKVSGKNFVAEKFEVYQDVYLKKGTTITVSADYREYNIGFHAIYDDNTMEGWYLSNLTDNGKRKYRTFTLTKNIKTISYKYGESTNWQTELGDKPTEYEPYHEPITTNIYLDEPLRKLGNYVDYIDFENGKVVRNVEKLVLNGSENWYSSVENGKRRAFLNGRSSVGKNIVLSDKYVKDTVNYTYPDFNKIMVNGAGSLIIGLDNNIFPDLETYKTWLKTNNVDAYLPLATPTEETIELPNTPTIKGTTIIEVDTNIQPSNVEVVYKGKE